MKHLATINTALETSTRAKAFAQMLRLLALHRGRPSEARDHAESLGYTQVAAALSEYTKTTVAVGSTTGPDWTALTSVRQLAEAFLNSVRNSVFDTMLPAMIRVPMRSRVLHVTTGIQGKASIAEGSVKPIAKLDIGGVDTEPRKSVATIIVSQELLNFAEAPGLLETELARAMAADTDVQFLADLIAAGTAPIASSGATLANVMTDIDALLAAISFGADARLFLIMSPLNVRGLALKITGTGERAFAGVGVTGGELMPNLRVLASDALTNAAVMVDASQLMASADPLLANVMRQSTVTLDTSPDSPPTASTITQSLWQRDLIALVAERFFSVTVPRPTALASLSGVNY